MQYNSRGWGTALGFSFRRHMSHYTEMKVNAQVKNEKELIAALEEVFGEGSVEVHDKGVKLGGGYDSTGANKTAHLVIKKDSIQKARLEGCYGWNSIGYERQKDGGYMLHADPADFSAKHQGLVAQGYTEHTSRSLLKKKGYIINKEVQKDGKIILSAKKL